MQRKYNMALQHFYQAATHTNDEDDVKARLNDLSDSEEEDLFTLEKDKEELYELKERKSDHNKNTFFSFKKEMTVKRVKPNSICSKRGCFMFLVWSLLFLIGVLSLTYFLQLAINRIKPKPEPTHQPIAYGRFKEKTVKPSSDTLETCSDFKVEKLWHKTYKKFQTESAIRLVDVNKDGVDDLIMGFVTSLDGFADIHTRKKLCEKYYNDIFPCFGGVLAIDGKNGSELWIHYSLHDIYAVNCNGDIDYDGVADCLVAGRGGAFEAISGHDGKALWTFLDTKHRNENMNLYTPQFINDVDGDGVMDVLQIHGGDPFADPYSKERLVGKILFLSGKTGLVLSSQDVPDKTESYSSPVVYTLKNGSDVVVFGTGGETHQGHLFAILLNNLYDGKMDTAVTILTDVRKGFMNPPILVDINKDGVVDLINAGYSENITAVDGETLKIIWTFHLETYDTETYSIPGVGYFNDDDVVDFFIRLNTGPGFPIYYNSEVTILDGKTGKRLLSNYTTSAPAQSSPLTVSMEGTGNDLFLHWSVDCEGHEHEGGAYKYVDGTSVHESSRTDSCMARFDTKSFSKFFVMNKKTGLPGKEIYYSKNNEKLEHSDASRKRHIGVPDHGGVQRILQTGSVVQSLDTKPSELSNSFDIVFAMFYIKPPNVRAIRPSDMACIKDYRKKAKAGKLKNAVDVDANERMGIYDEGDSAVNFCLGKRLNNTKFDSQTSATKKNFNHGKLTLYRLKVTCKCDHEEKCARVLPKPEQGWTGYMGSLANGYFNKRPSFRFSAKKS